MKKQQTFDEWLADHSPFDNHKADDKWYDGIIMSFYRTKNYLGELLRLIKGKFQRWLRGYSDCDLWNLNDTIVGFILPRLEAFKKSERHGYPLLDPRDQIEAIPGCEEDHQRWEYILDEMIWSFRYLKFCEESPEDYPEFSSYSMNQVTQEWEINKERVQLLNKRMNQGLDFFARYLPGLWD